MIFTWVSTFSRRFFLSNFEGSAACGVNGILLVMLDRGSCWLAELFSVIKQCQCLNEQVMPFLIFFCILTTKLTISCTIAKKRAKTWNFNRFKINFWFFVNFKSQLITCQDFGPEDRLSGGSDSWLFNNFFFRDSLQLRPRLSCWRCFSRSFGWGFLFRGTRKPRIKKHEHFKW